MIANFRKNMAESPEFARFVPMLVWVGITFLGGMAHGDLKFWSYPLKVGIGVWFVWQMRAFIPEMRWAFSWEAVVTGIVVFAVWVGLDPYYPKIGLLFKYTPESIWNPFARFGDGSIIAWALIVVRIFGMTILVPPIEDVYYRSFFYRVLIRYDFQTVAMNHFDGVAFAIVPVVFGLVHPQWLAGIFCGVAYQWLVLHRNRLGDAMTAHAITNFLLAVYVVWKGGDAWNFF